MVKEHGTPSAPQRRHLAILFSDLNDSTTIAESMRETEHYAELLADLTRIYESVIERHGGTVVQIQGDGVLAAFGFPVAREDDARRATEAALELHEQVRRLPVKHLLPASLDLSLHSGVHSGLVLVVEGDPVRGIIEMLGEATIVATRLSSAAAHDEVLVSETSLGAERDFFEIGERRDLSLKGKTEHLIAYPVRGRSSVATHFEAWMRRGLAPFRGRGPELAALERAFEDAAGGRTRSVIVTAPAGVGKTRLAEGVPGKHCRPRLRHSLGLL